MLRNYKTISLQALRLVLAVGVMALSLTSMAWAQTAADGFAPNINGLVRAVAVQSDGKIVVGGLFSSVNGQARNNLARLNVDGSLDPSFSLSTDGTVFALCIQSGKIVVGGSFALLGGQARASLGRLNADGTLDTAFNVGANAAVYTLTMQSDYQVLVGGNFTTLSGQTHNHIGRISNTGALDTSFNPAASGAVNDMGLQNDGRIVIGGTFTTVNNQTLNNIARLNADGSLDTSFNPNANNGISALAVQPDGKILLGGDFTSISNQTRNRIARINADGSLDAVFNPNADAFVDAIVLRPDGRIFIGGAFTAVAGTTVNHLAPLNANGTIGNALLGGTNNTVYAMAIQGDGKLLAGGQFTTVGGSVTRNHLVRYNTDNTLDSDFPGGANGGVVALAAQPDGKLLVGGSFTSLVGAPISYIARLNQNGSIDSSFNALANGNVYAIAVQQDGKILVGGDFTNFNGQAHGHLVRLLSNGNVDSNFNPTADDGISGIVVQPDGKILVSGFFFILNGQFQPYIARLNSNGTLDTSFNPYFDDLIYTMALQTDGKILLGGFFTSVNNQPRAHIARLNADGTLDANFNPGADDLIYSIAVQTNGKILVGGGFTALGGLSRKALGRLNANGTADSSFNAAVEDFSTPIVNTVALQTDGKILVGGGFSSFAGQLSPYLARLNNNGALDTSFVSGANGLVDKTLIQTDGKIVAAGYFSALGGQARPLFGRLTNTDAAIQYLSAISANTSLLWGRTGTNPDITRATFEASTDGISYNLIGAATRSALGSWNLNNLSLLTDQTFYIRARGYYASGLGNGSGSVAEFVAQMYIPSVVPCTFSLNPISQNFTAAGGSGNVALTASNSSCAWTAQSNAAWITPAVFSGSGSTSIGYVVAANPGAQRSGTMSIGGQTFTVTQDAFSCSYNVGPQAFNLSAGSGGGSLNITTTAGCAWTATSNAAWLTMTTPNGNGSGTAGFTMAANPNAAPRTGTLTVAGQTITVTQDSAIAVAGLQFYPLDRPVRILDTRAGQGNCDNVSTPINGGSSLSTFARLSCEGVIIPATVQAVVGNLTVINQTAQSGYLTIYPNGQNAPLAANMIYGPSGILSNNFTVGLSANGNFNIFAEKTLDAIVDISGYYAPPAAGGLYYHPLSKPIRLQDTRAGQGNCDNVSTPIAGGTSLTTLARTTCEGLTIPQAAQAIVGNATVINVSGQVGYLTIYPNGVQVPLAANMVYFPGQLLSNAFTVSLSANGEFNIFGERTIDMVIDVAGYYSAEQVDVNGTGLLFNPLPTPVRLLDTRAGQGNCDSVNAPINAGISLTKLARMTCEGQLIPNTAQSIIGTVTVINQTNQAGYLTLYPTGQAAPLAANMIYTPNQLLSNAFVVGLSAGGQFNIFAERTLEAIVDVSGYFAP